VLALPWLAAIGYALRYSVAADGSSLASFGVGYNWPALVPVLVLPVVVLLIAWLRARR
jgi:hypothetical protein